MLLRVNFIDIGCECPVIFRYNINISEYIGNAAFVNHFHSFLIPKMISYLFSIYILLIICRHYFKILLITFQYKTIIWTLDQKLILCFWNKFIISWQNIPKSCVNSVYMQIHCRHTQLVSATATGDSESGCSTAGGIVGPVYRRNTYLA